VDIVPAPHPLSSDLALLEQEELAVSEQRSLLHQRIDDLYLSAPLDDEQAARLDELEELERSVSLERERLHRRIDSLRAEIGLAPVREARGLDDVD
jgi:hypothetical protein